MGEIIYEKHFHKETIEEIERERIDFVEAFGEDAEQAPSFDEIMKKIYSNVTYASSFEQNVGVNFTDIGIIVIVSKED